MEAIKLRILKAKKLIIKEIEAKPKILKILELIVKGAEAKLRILVEKDI